MAISLTIDGAQVALKKGSSIEYVSENRIFTDADDYSLSSHPTTSKKQKADNQMVVSFLFQSG